MKNIIDFKNAINFCETNNFDFEIETRNGVKRVSINVPEGCLVTDFFKAAKQNKEYCVDFSLIKSKVYIYTPEGWRETQKRWFKLVTVAEMQAVTSKLIKLGYGEYSVLVRVPFCADSLMFPSWDSFAFESSAIGSGTIYFDLAEYSSQVMLPDRFLELAEKLKPNQNSHGRGSEFTVNTLDETLSDLINKGFADYYVCRTPFEDEDDKYETFGLGQVAQVTDEVTDESVYFSLEKI